MSVTDLILGLLYAILPYLLWGTIKTQYPDEEVSRAESFVEFRMLLSFIKGVYDIYVLTTHLRLLRRKMATKAAEE